MKYLNLTIMLVVIHVNNAIAAVNEEECLPVPGFTMLVDTRKSEDEKFITPVWPYQLEQQALVTNEEALKNMNDLRFKTCCDFKNKCEFGMTVHVHLYDIPSTCQWNLNCTDIQTHKLLIQREFVNTPDRPLAGFEPYCNNFTERGHLIEEDPEANKIANRIQYCTGAVSCFENASNDTQVLMKCLANIFDSYLQHPGFFSMRHFPYKSFQFEKISTKGRSMYKLHEDGKIFHSLNPKIMSDEDEKLYYERLSDEDNESDTIDEDEDFFETDMLDDEEFFKTKTKLRKEAKVDLHEEL